MVRRRSLRDPQPSSIVGRGWLAPYWLERQADPDSPAYTVGGRDPSNTTGRNWTILGALGTPGRAAVDQRGLLATGAGHSIDWWVRADDKWHFPSRAAAVRQNLVENTPVVETRMRVAGGDVIHRVFGVAGGDGDVVIEVENTSPAPIALALALRPYDLVGPGRIEHIELDDDGLGVLLDGDLVLRLPRLAGSELGGSLATGDLAELVVAGEALGGVVGDALPSLPVTCPSGVAHAALLFPLVHTSSISFVAPIVSPSTRDGGSNRVVPTAEQVARGWQAQTETGARFSLPDGPIADTFEAARRHLRLLRAGDDFVAEPLSSPGVNWRDAAPIMMATDQMGWHRDVAEVVLTFRDRQNRRGEIVGRDGELDGTGAALAALGHHMRLTRIPEMARDQVELVVGAARYLDRLRRKGGDRPPNTEGLLPARGGDSDEGRGLEFRYADNFWALRGLSDAAEILTMAGEVDASADVAAVAADLRIDLLSSFEGVIEAFGSDALPATPHRSVDERAIDALVAVWPAAVLRPEHPMMMATADTIRQRFMHGAAHHNTIGPRGLGTYRTARLAMAELMALDSRALERLRWLTTAATPTVTWPRTVHPQLGSGTSGEGHHGTTTAHVVSLIRSLLVHSSVSDDPTLTLLGVFPPEWLGQGIEVHEAPTEHGRLSYAVRWHGARPALLWELEQATPRPVVIRVPGLDPEWSTTQARGEALLAAPSIDQDGSLSGDVDLRDVLPDVRDDLPPEPPGLSFS